MSKFDGGPARPLQQHRREDRYERDDGAPGDGDEFPGLDRLDRDELDECDDERGD